MRRLVRRTIVAVVGLHGLIHLLGAAEAFGVADVEQLTQPIGPLLGVAWFVSAAVVIAAAVMIAVDARAWWIVALVGAAMSQAVLLTSFADAAFGTVGNVLLLLAAGYGYASRGPRSFRASYRNSVEAIAGIDLPSGVVVEADLDELPAPVAAYIRRTGAIGQPRVSSFRARIRGRIRPAADRPWMTFTAEQTNTYGDDASRVFLMDATMFGLPVVVFHRFVDRCASMRGKVLSVFPVLDEEGEEMAHAETVTLFNDLCLFAPAGLIDAPVAWDVVDDRRVRGTYTNGPHTVSAELVFNERDELVDFISDDRLAPDADGRFEPRRWSTPIHQYGQVGTRWLAVEGEARWHPHGEEPFTYIELRLDDVTYNAARSADATPTAPTVLAG